MVLFRTYLSSFGHWHQWRVGGDMKEETLHPHSVGGGAPASEGRRGAL